MDLIKKSASVTENDYKRVTLLFFKEIKVLQYWYAYTATEKYDSHAKYYLKYHKDRTAKWYDREGCMKILGICSFGDYLKDRGVGSGVSDIYNLYAAFLGIFWEDEYYKWTIEFHDNKTPLEHINWVRSFSKRNTDLIDNWIRLKKALR
jgi:hypothetical protein